MPHRARAVVAVLTAAALLGVVPAADADDAAMKAGILPALDALVPKERAALQAANRVSRISRGRTPTAHRKARRAARRAQPKARRAAKAAEVFGGLLLGQQPSSARGEKVKRMLLRALALDKQGFRLMFKSLRAYRRGLTPRANGLVHRSNRKLRTSGRIARRGGRLLARL